MKQTKKPPSQIANSLSKCAEDYLALVGETFLAGALDGEGLLTGEGDNLALVGEIFLTGEGETT